MTTPPLSGPDAEIYRYLLQVVAIGVHKGAWTAADVVRVSEAHLDHPRTLRRAYLNERVRADRLATELDWWHRHFSNVA